MIGQHVRWAGVALAGVITGMVLACGGVRANAASAEYAAGGLVFKPSATISMASEDLYRSMYQVRVGYVFHSTAAATQDLLLAFPMPVLPVTGLNAVYADDATEAPTGRVHHDLQPVPNYLDFTVRVNGQQVTTRASGRALLHGRDVSRLLQEAGMPLLFAVDVDSERAAQALPAAKRAQLVSAGLLRRAASLNTMEPDIYVPLWDYQAVFEWHQAFTPGDTRVDISYAPRVGAVVDVAGSESGYPPDSAGFSGYCIDGAMRQALGRYSPAHWDISTLGYVLTTANYWKGSIGRFHLVVEKPAPTDIVAFCPLDAKKITPTRFEWTRMNHVPKGDIKVMFFTSTGEP